MNAESIAKALGNAKRAGNGWLTRCPGHDDSHASLSIGDQGDKVLWNCKAGCSQLQVMDALKSMNLLPELKNTGKKKEKRNVIETYECTYDYVDEKGVLLYQVERYKTNDPENPKTFKQKDANGVYSLKNCRRVLYNLPAVLEAIALGNQVFIPEGEKDCDNLNARGLVATTNASGGITWHDNYTEQLRGADVVLLPDNDDTGRARVERLSKILVGNCKSVKVVPLYDENGPKKADISDWLAEGHKISELFALIDKASVLTSETVRTEEKNVIEIQPEDEITNTDLANAEKFIDYFGADLRYTNERGWCVWDGNIWQLGGKLDIQEKAKQMSRKLLSEADTKPIADRHKIRSWAIKLQSAEKIANMVKLASSDTSIRAKDADFDSDPLILSCKNGILNIETREFKAHERESLLAKLADVDYDPAAAYDDENNPCEWMKFLKRIMNNDMEMVWFLQRAAGYSLSGYTTEQKIFFAYGGGGNGKSKFLIPLEKIMGTYSAYLRSNSLMDTGRETQLDSLHPIVGARFVRSSEIGQRAKLNEALVKDLSGGEKVKARLLTHEPFDFEPKCKLWLHGNHKPRISGTDYGIWRRMILIPFEVEISDEEKDSELEEKLLREKSQILNWMLDGFMMWKQMGLKPPEKVLAATKEYESESDTVGEFLEQRTGRSDALSAKAQDFYKAYVTWCGANGHREMSNTSFGIDLKKRGIDKVRKRFGYVYEGVYLLSEDEDDENTGNEKDNSNSDAVKQHSIF